MLNADDAAVGEMEFGDVKCVAEGMLGNVRVRIAVHAAARISRDLLDLDHRLAEPAQGRGLHGSRNPLIKRGDDGAGECRGRIHFDRPRRAGHHRPARRAKRRQRRRLGGAGIAVGAWRIRRLRPTVIGMRRSAGNGEFFIVFVGRVAWRTKRQRLPGWPRQCGCSWWYRREGARIRIVLGAAGLDRRQRARLDRGRLGRGRGRGWSRFSGHGIRPTLRHNRWQGA